MLTLSNCFEDVVPVPALVSYNRKIYIGPPVTLYMFNKLRKPHIVLFFLSPLLAELMTGSAPPLEFFNPLGFLFICAWYGCGVLLIREISFRKNLNWKGIFTLGTGFGILEEGIFVKTFFDPRAVDLGDFALFGRFAGTNVPWAVYLTLFHALHSILFPILLTYVLFKDDIKRPWLSKRGITICSIVLAGLSVFGWFVSDPSQSGTPYIPSGVHFLGSFLVIFVLGLVSLRFVRTERDEYQFPMTKNARKIFLQGIAIGFLFSLGVFATVSLSKNTVISVFYILIIVSIIFYIKKKVQNNLPAFCYFIIGYYIFWAFMGFLQEFNGVIGMSVTGIGFMLFLLVMARYVNKQYVSDK